MIFFSAVDTEPLTAGPQNYSSAVPAIAQSYVIQMQEKVKKADEAALRGSQLMADGDYDGAIGQYRAALDLLPDAPMTEQRRRAYVKQFARASVLLARQRADEGRYNEAIQLVEEVLQPSMDPDNIDAKRLLEQLNDPDYYNPALTPQHLERVRKVKLALKTGQGYIDLGDYDRADREYNRALSEDPYNIAARRGMESGERHKMDYYDVARNHTRSAFLREISRGWETPIPTDIKGDFEFDPGTIDSTTTDIRMNEQKLKTIIFPSIEFVDTPLSEAIQLIDQRSKELDMAESDPARKGVNIILSVGGGSTTAGPAQPAAGGLGFEGAGSTGAGLGGGGVGDTPISLRLSNVPLAEVLRYTTALANLKYKVEAHAVLIVPISTPDADLFTNTYVVPPNFLSTGTSGGGDAGAADAADPFTTPAASGGNVIKPRKTAKQVLESAGIVFGTGSMAIYSVANSSVIVRNTQDQMELVEAFIESIRGTVEKQIYVTARFVEISESDVEELGFDWLLGSFNMAGGVFGQGGTVGNQAPVAGAAGFPLANPPGVPVTGGPVTAGNRSGSGALTGNNIDALIALAGGGAAPTVTVAPAVFGISGVFTNPQFQMMIRALSQQKGVDLLSAPSVMARSGQRAKIEIIREFIYPTEYDPPEIPNQIGSTGGIGVGGGTSFIPVTPATPTAFETRNTGITLEVDPVLGADEYTIDLNLAPEVVEFDGFINYGTPIFGSNSGPPLFTPTVLTANRIVMPVFNVRKVTTQVTIWDGQTVALGGLIREDIQDVQDKIPFFGDLPLFGRLFRSSVEQHLKRNLTIFVTAQIMDPSGQPIHGKIIDEPRPEAIPRPKVSAPAPFTSMPIPYEK